MLTDLIDAPLSATEIGRLPDRLRLRYWAAEISDGVTGLSDLRLSDVRHECRCLLSWLSRLSPGTKARYVGIASAIKGKRCVIEAVSPDDISISVEGFADRFLVDPLDLEP